MRRRHHVIACLVALPIAVALIAVPTAGATYVKGHQKIVNERAGKFRMKGDLIGKFRVTAFHERRTKPFYNARGKERFNGCLDINQDRSCAGDPSGKLFFKFRYWAKFDEDGAIQLGTCAHRVVDGEGGFAGATGFLQMVDIPIGSAPFVKTSYEGEIVLAGFGRATRPSGPGSC